MAAQVKGTGLQVDGLREAINALGKIDKEAKAEAVDIMRDASKDVQAVAQSNIGKGQYRGPQQRGMVGRSATSAGAATKLRASKYPWALKAEYGETWSNIPQNRGGRGGTRIKSQSSFRSRHANRFSPPTNPSNLLNSKGGYVILAAIRKRGPHVIQEANNRMFKLIDRTLKREMG